jgi:signal transduction histidine kinase
MTSRTAVPPVVRTATSKVLVLAGLAVFIILIYSVIAGLIGRLIGGTRIWLSLVATVCVAVAFEPARRHIQRWVNQMIYGRRATPYEVLAEITGRLASTESEEGLLQRMASMLAAGTGADRAAVWLRTGSNFLAVATEPAGQESVVAGAGALPGTSELIQDNGEVLGAFTVEKGADETPTGTERLLIADLAGSAGLVLRKLRLGAALEDKAEELRESRRRLVDAQDVERRLLERELYGGAQQRVIAVKLKLGLALQAARAEGADKVAALVTEMVGDAQLAIDQIRTLARGIYPPLLEAEGLGPAVASLAGLASVEVLVHTSVPNRYPLPLEAAIYFCVSESLTNAAKHGRQPVVVTIAETDSALTFSVTDSGPGFDPQSTSAGVGLRNMADRLGTLGGTFTVVSAPGSATTVCGQLPLADSRAD